MTAIPQGSTAVMARRERQRAYLAEYYRKNAERIKAAVRARWKLPNAKQKDKVARDKRRDKIRAYDRMRAKRDREKKKTIIDRWIRNNPERHRLLNVAKAQRRRAKLRSAGGSWSAGDVKAAIAAQAGRCWWCSKTLKAGYHVDHRIPIAKGGSNDRSNIVIACAPCNRAKSAKMPWEFAGRLL